MTDSFAPTHLPIELTRDGSWVRTLLLYDVAGNAAPATGWALAGAVRRAAGDLEDDPVATLTIAPVADAPGQFTVSLRGSDLDAVGNAQQTVRLAYAIRATKSGATPELLLHGPVILNPRIFA